MKNKPRTEPLESFENSERENVPLKPKKPSERSYEAQVRQILSKHGVLTHDGWQFVTDKLVDDLISWKIGSKDERR